MKAYAVEIALLMIVEIFDEPSFCCFTIDAEVPRLEGQSIVL